ncbi:MAG: LuxR C-terminal-related transcriptional regulator [Cyanobacteria bacterium P01_G01_bin.38]
MTLYGPQLHRPSQSAPVRRSAPRPPAIRTSAGNLLAQAILASMVDGILILTETGQWVQGNSAARHICDRITGEQPGCGPVPAEIWRACQALIDSRSQYPRRTFIVEAEMEVAPHDHIRIRARWFETSESHRPYILVILEDRRRSMQNLAITEVARYDLTPREADVWLLHRKDYMYQEIAEELHISINTVKKHMKNINAKRQVALVMEECCAHK